MSCLVVCSGPSPGPRLSSPGCEQAGPSAPANPGNPAEVLSPPEPLPANSRLWAKSSSGPWFHSPFKWSPLPGAVGLRVPAARSPAGVVWSAPVGDRSATLPFAMATAGKVEGTRRCRTPFTTTPPAPSNTQRSQPQPVPGDHLT